MAAITTRAGKGAPLTNAELDANFNNINDGITTAAAITGGTINGTAIGGSTAAAGAFTTLTASSTATLNTLASSGATITGGSINATTIGATTPSTGSFTTLAANGQLSLTGTGAALMNVGNTAQRPTPATGMLRFNTTLTSFEGYNGSAWGSIGGGATGGGADQVFVENDQVVTTNYAIPATKNALTTGPITINSGVTVTVSDGARWIVV